VPVREPKDWNNPPNPNARFEEEIVECCAHLRDRVLGVLEEGSLPMVVGGDHSIAAGTVAGISSHYHAKNEKIGLLWFDAHGDMNTPDSSPSGNIHGMPLAACIGRGADAMTRLGQRFPMVDVERAVIVGARDIDSTERKEILDAGIRCYTMREIDIKGMARVMEEALEIVNNGTCGFHLSFDVDGTDPSLAPGVGTPVPGGTTWRESHLVMEIAAETQRMLGIEMTEVNPILDDRNRTAVSAVELLLSALGKRIL
ncbi:MAG: arginase, partial [Planctomycetota bacterium]